MSIRNLSVAAFVAFAGLSTSALAADMPVKAAPRYAAPVSTWTGLYAGFNVGYSMGRADILDSSRVIASGATIYSHSADLSVAGVIGGGQIGYNWQMSNCLVGLEADYQ